MTDSRLTRRTLLGGIGAGTMAIVAGCLGAQMPRSNPEMTPMGGVGTAPDLESPASVDVDRIAADPTDVPSPVDWAEPREHTIELETVEVTAEIEPGATFDFMTFDGRIPGPMVRVRRGDRVRFRLTNPSASGLPHNIDFHAVYGPGGGAEHTTVTPGQTAEIEFTAMYPGIHIYHCAVPGMDHHISSGMFGAILVEPEDGLPPVDREFYLGQHELYTAGQAGQAGHHAFDTDAMAREEPTYVVFNGEANAFTDDRHGPITAATGERIRLYFANGGPNLTSSWHAIGNVWTRLYRDGDLYSDPARYVETTSVAPGTVTAAEIDTPVPGPITIVDHALSRAGRRGAKGVIEVAGDPDPEVYDGGEDPEMAENRNGSEEFDGWLSDVDTYDGIVDATGRDRVTVSVGASGNGGAFAYDPTAVEITSGTTIRWEWTGDGGLHDVAHVDGVFESELTDEAGFTFEHRFEDSGTARYRCTPHEAVGMKGVVVVD